MEEKRNKLQKSALLSESKKEGQIVQFNSVQEIWKCELYQPSLSVDITVGALRRCLLVSNRLRCFMACLEGIHPKEDRIRRST
jgi:hypothetical protein